MQIRSISLVEIDRTSHQDRESRAQAAIHPLILERIKFWKVFEAKTKQVINETKNYTHIRDIRKQAAADLTGFLINNKYKQTASMKNFIDAIE